MASSLISGAISLLLILIAGYVIATGILTIGETMIYTQSDMASNQESIKQTVISANSTYSGTTLLVYVYNEGSTSFTTKDFENMELYVYPEVSGKIRYIESDFGDIKITDDVGKEDYWDIVNVGMWDPSEALEISILGFSSKPDRVKFVTSNGVSAYSNVIAI